MTKASLPVYLKAVLAGEQVINASLINPQMKLVPCFE